MKRNWRARRRRRVAVKSRHCPRGAHRLEPRLLLGGAVLVDNVVLWNLEGTLLGISHAASHNASSSLHLLDTQTTIASGSLPASATDAEAEGEHESLLGTWAGPARFGDGGMAAGEAPGRIANFRQPSGPPSPTERIGSDLVAAIDHLLADLPDGIAASDGVFGRVAGRLPLTQTPNRSSLDRLLRIDTRASTAALDFLIQITNNPSSSHSLPAVDAAVPSGTPARDPDPRAPGSPIPSGPSLVGVTPEGTAATGPRSDSGVLLTGAKVNNVKDGAIVAASVGVHEAEDASFTGAVVATDHAGFTGTGFLDFVAASGDFVDWTVDAPQAGSFDLSFRYALENGNRPLELRINGVAEVPSFDFPATGSFANWGTVTHTTLLDLGENTVRLTAIGSSGANIDHLDVTPTPIATTISDAFATEGSDGFLVFDVGLTQPPTELITLDLQASDITAQGGLTGDFGLDPMGDPVDYANQEFEVSIDGGASWQTATNGTEVSFAIGQDALKTRLAINNDLAAEGLTPETMTLTVASVLAGTVDDITSSGLGSIVDDDTGAGILEAEDAVRSGSVFANNHAGFTGSGFVDFVHATGDFLEWTVDVSTAGTFDLSFQYALESGNRPLEFALNGVPVIASLDFPATGSFATWQAVTRSVQLNAGQNTVRLTAIGSSGANFDHLEVVRTVLATTISDAFAEEGTDDFLVFDLGLTRSPSELITLALAATDVSAKGGLIGDFGQDPAGDPVDYANQEFEVSTDGGASWTPATDGTKVSFAIGETALKVRLAINDDLAGEGGTPETMQLGVASVLAGSVDDVTDTGQGSITDNDTLDTGPREAEDASFAGPVIANNHPGFTGTGFLDFVNSTSDFVEWTVNVPTDGIHQLTWRYALGSPNRPLRLILNGQPEVLSLDFPSTGNWDDWGTVSQLVNLTPGANTVRLTAIGSSGGNIDHLQVSQASIDLAISDASATEGLDGFLVFDIGLSNPSSELVTLDMLASGGTATGGLIADFGLDPTGDPVDFADQEFEVSADGGASWQPAANGTEVSFAIGQTDLKVRLAINDDLANEGLVAESMTLSVGSVLAGTLTDSSDAGTGSIVDDDVAIVSVSDANATEGLDGFLVFDLGISAPQNELITLDLLATDVTAKGGLIADFGLDPTGDPVDYGNQEFEVSVDGGATWQSAAGGTEVSFTVGQTDLMVRLAVNDDEASEGVSAETMTLSVGSILLGPVDDASDTGTGSIIDNEVSIVTISDATATEGVDGFLVFDLALSDALNDPLVLDLLATDGTARGGLVADFGLDLTEDPIDYADQEWEVSNDGGGSWQPAANGTEVVFSIGQTNLQVRSPIHDDLRDELLETMTLGIGSVVSGSVDDTSDIGSGSIVDDDAPTLLIADAEGTESAGAFLVFDLQLSIAPAAAITLDLLAVDGTAKGGLIADFGVDPSGDPVDFANQEFEVSHDGGTSWQAAVNGTEVTFGVGQTDLQVRSAINDDLADEPSLAETMTLSVASVLDGSLEDASDTGLGSILDDDAPDVLIADASAAEGTDDFLVFDLALSLAPSAPITLDLLAADGTAKGGLASDFGVDPTGDPIDFANHGFEWSSDAGSSWQPANNGTEVVFSLGQTDLKVRLAINDDLANEGLIAETMMLSVSSVLSGTVNDASDTGLGSIVDNDVAVIAISDAAATEGADDFLVFAIDLGAPQLDPITLDLLASDLTANGGLIADFGVDPTGDPVDYSNQEFEVSSDGGVIWQPAVNGTEVSFSVGQTALHVRLAINNDLANEGLVDETMTLSVSSVVVGSVDDFSDTGTGAIADNDLAILSISDATGTEGTDDFLVFDVGLTTPQNQPTTFSLLATDGNAKGGLIADFGIDPGGDPVDYANQEFEVSIDGGTVWQPASGGNQLSFTAGQTDLKVRLAINDDLADETPIAETLTLGIGNVLVGVLDDDSDTGLALIYDDEVVPGSGCSPISLLPCTSVRVEGGLVADFDGTDSGLPDRVGRGTGFTMADPSSNPGNPSPAEGVIGYWPDQLEIDPDTGQLRISATPGIQFVSHNSLDNALGVGLNVPSKAIRMRTTLTDIPAAPGGYAQAGLWFGQAEGGGSGTSEDNYIKLIIVSPSAGNYHVEALYEQDGAIADSVAFDIIDTADSVTLELFLDPANDRVIAEFDVNGGLKKQLAVFTEVPEEWFSKDQAGIDPTIATRSFGGIFASSRLAPPQVFSFSEFSIAEQVSAEIPSNLSFDRWSIPVSLPTSMEFGPDGRLYVATLFGTIHALTVDTVNRTFQEEVITTIPDLEGGGRLTLGLAIDPDSTAQDVILWVAHSSGSASAGELNSGKVSRLSGPGFTQKSDVIVGLPRAIANHGTNDIDFGPDGRLYVWQGGNTGAGAANTETSEFGDRSEQVLSAALLVADVKDPSFNGVAGANIGEFVEEFYSRTSSDVLIYASGMRNTFDGVFHSNGRIYAPDNGLGVTGTAPPVPRLGDPADRNITTMLGEDPIDNPGPQPDPLNLIIEGGYYGHPNPYRDEVVFKDGSFQGFDDFDADPTNDLPAGHPPYELPIANLGSSRSANGIIEYTGDNFFGQLNGDLLITNFSQGDDITRVELSADGLSALSESPLIGNFVDPLPLVMGSDGIIFVGEFNGNITVLEPSGTWRTDLPLAPELILDAGSAVVDDKLYVVGGKTAVSHVSSLYIYDPDDPIDELDDTWSSGPDLPGVPVENPAAVGFDDKLYVFGGSTQPFSGAVNSANVFDPSSSTWSPLPPMPTPRGGATAQVVDDKIYVIGGLAADGASLDLVEVFDPETGQWTPGDSMQIRRDNAGSAVVDDKLYVFGGRTRDAGGATPDPSLASLEIYDPGTGQWSFGAAMPTGRRVVQVGILDDRIQVIGGEGGLGGVAFDQHEEYDPVTDTWRLLPSIDTPRHGGAFGTIDDVIYVAAGGHMTGSSFTDLVEAFTF